MFTELRRNATINISRTVSIKGRERFLRRQADWLRANRLLDVRKQPAHLRLVLNGDYQYSSARLTEQALYCVCRRIRKLWRSSCDGEASELDAPVRCRTSYAKAWFQISRITSCG